MNGRWCGGEEPVTSRVDGGRTSRSRKMFDGERVVIGCTWSFHVFLV